MTDAEIQRLAALAREATPDIKSWVHAYRIYDLPAQDEAYLEAVDPAAVLALIERVQRTEEDAALFQRLIRQYEEDGELNLRAELMNAMSADPKP